MFQAISFLFEFGKKRWLFFACLCLATISCQLVKQTSIDPFRLPDDYISQKRIVLQGFSTVPTSNGEKACVYFGYDRDNRHVVLPNGIKVAVDLIEFKLLKHDNSWYLNPIMIFIDDDFDGYANRFFKDQDLNGSLELIYDIEKRKVVMDERIFEEISPESMKRLPAPRGRAIR